MIAFLDVDYRPDGSAVAACVTADGWSAPGPGGEYTTRVARVEPYIPGQFYKRELPCLQAVLALLPISPDTLVVDGYVWLKGPADPGLGAHLFRALGERLPVVGVAKTPFQSATAAVAVLRGSSTRPLHVTSAGVPVGEAAKSVASMHGPHRIPTLLGRVDRLCRGS
ncbi:MAG: endonuclease V [Deltaproteobacteria bacterium]|nr:endonuclease V [Deltaproteobacteria bacterium]